MLRSRNLLGYQGKRGCSGKKTNCTTVFLLPSNLVGYTSNNSCRSTAHVMMRFTRSADFAEPNRIRTREGAWKPHSLFKAIWIFQPVNLSAQFYGNAVHTKSGSPWGVRAQIAFLFPKLPPKEKMLLMEEKLKEMQKEQSQKK